ncbi:MAG: MFS transporter [Clostridia bacterium]|nr:MFS transporter [Clostridia bacterium]
MTTIFITIIFILYIGLGLPDSSFGTALPAMWLELNLPLSLASVVSLLISIGTTISSFYSAKLVNKFGTGFVVAFSTLLSALSLLGFYFTNSFWFTCVLTIPLGLGAGAIDSAINSYVASRYSSAIMSFLHCFYGIGVSVTPFIFSYTLSFNNDWRSGYYYLFLIQIIIALLAFLSIPLWNKQKIPKEYASNVEYVDVSYARMAKSPAIRAVWIAFFTTCALEFTCDVWGASYLVSLGLTESRAASFITLYYVGITLGRFLSGILNTKISPEKVTAIGYVLIGLGITTLFLPLPAVYKGIGLAFIGLGNGPTFPNLTYLTAEHFGKNTSPSLVASQMVASNLGIMIVPPLLGLVFDYTSISLFPISVAVSFVLLTVYTVLYFKRPKISL